MATVQKRGKNSYRVIVSDGFDINGKRKTYSKTVKTTSKREAEKEASLFEAEIHKGIFYSSSKMTFGEYAKLWLTDYVKPNLSPKTYDGYVEKLNSYVYEDFINKRIDKLTTRDIDLLYNKLKLRKTNRKDEYGNKKTLAPKTIHHVHELLSSMFNTAVKWNIIPYNPCEKANKPKLTRAKVSFYNKDEVIKLLNCLRDEPLKYQCAITIALFGGLRRGEILGLHWDDINFENNTYEVKRAVIYQARKGISEKTPKTDQSRRQHKLPEICFDLLKDYKQEQGHQKELMGNKWIDSPNIFTTNIGGIMNPDSIKKWFDKFLKRNNLRPIRLHDLRHTFASLMIDSNIPYTTISKMMGHSNTTTTLNIYGHSFKSTEDEAIEVFNNIINSNKKEEV